jgi:hypothetical protein
MRQLEIKIKRFWFDRLYLYRFCLTYYILVCVKVREKKSALHTLVNIIESNRGKKQLILDNFKF